MRPGVQIYRCAAGRHLRAPGQTGTNPGANGIYRRPSALKLGQVRLAKFKLTLVLVGDCEAAVSGCPPQ
eukprot:scaffold49288_cov63-Phaeocystis_antarctica.AAC.1